MRGIMCSSTAKTNEEYNFIHKLNTLKNNLGEKLIIPNK